MKRLQDKFKQAALFLENNELPVIQYVYLFLAILFVRLCLEFFANQKLFTFHDALHIALWFTFIVLAFIVQLHLFAKVEIVKVFKLSVSCFSIALTAPIIDLIVSQGQFSKMNYLSIHSFSDFVFSYFTVGGASLSRGATIGIRVEIVLLMIACFNYLYTKRSSVWVAFIGSFSIYTVLFLSGTIPAVINALTHSFQLSYAPDDHSTELLLFCLDLILILLIAYKMAGKKNDISLQWNAVLDFLYCISAFTYGVWLARVHYPDNWSFNASTLYYLPLFPILFTCFLFFLNTTQQTLWESEPTVWHKKVFWLIFLSSCLMISFYTFFAALLIWSVLFVLYEKPTQWYRYRGALIVFKALLYTSFIFLGFLSFGAPLVGINVVHLSIILLLFTGLGVVNYYVGKCKK